MTLPLGLTLPAVADEDTNSGAIIVPADETSAPVEKAAADNSSSTPEPSGTTEVSLTPVSSTSPQSAEPVSSEPVSPWGTIDAG